VMQKIYKHAIALKNIYIFELLIKSKYTNLITISESFQAFDSSMILILLVSVLSICINDFIIIYFNIQKQININELFN